MSWNQYDVPCQYDETKARVRRSTLEEANRKADYKVVKIDVRVMKHGREETTSHLPGLQPNHISAPLLVLFSSSNRPLPIPLAFQIDLSSITTQSSQTDAAIVCNEVEEAKV